MKNPLFALITCGSALGLMTGAVAVHALHVAGAKDLSESTGWNPAVVEEKMQSSVFASAGPQLVGIRDTAAPIPASANRTDQVTVRALEAIADRLETLSEANADLRGQNSLLERRLNKTRKELGSIEMRVDLHSKEFRPIPRSSDGGILGGAEASELEAPLLLPPKDW